MNHVDASHAAVHLAHKFEHRSRGPELGEALEAARDLFKIVDAGMQSGVDADKVIAETLLAWGEKELARRRREMTEASAARLKAATKVIRDRSVKDLEEVERYALHMVEEWR